MTSVVPTPKMVESSPPAPSTAAGASARALVEERTRLLRGSSLHIIHWVVIAASLGVTFAAWAISSSQIEQKVSAQFDREAKRVVELIVDRMGKYEDALWGGVGALQTHSEPGLVGSATWKRFSDSLRIQEKYPGINGIGVIHRLSESEIAPYVMRQRALRPDFKVFPAHDQPEYFPITFVEPVAQNKKAVGLDIAHEENRYLAAKKARDSGTAQVTGPIVLVQDSEKTPGFLFYVPFYGNGPLETEAQRRAQFLGMVYAPFVVKQLMLGTLASGNRHVGLSIVDDGEVLFSELDATSADFDPHPLFERQVEVELYGRVWQFDIRTNLSFRSAASSSQPLTVLFAGLFIDFLLFGLFVALTRANRRAVEFADAANRDLVNQTSELAASNADLQQFAYVSSHDLQEPLRMVTCFAGLIEEELDATLTDEHRKYLGYVIEGGKRMQTLIQDLLKYAKVGSPSKGHARIELSGVVDDATENLALMIAEKDAIVHCGELPAVMGDDVLLTQVFQNLIANAIKFSGEARAEVWIETKKNPGGGWLVSVRDNGIGIDPQFKDQVFIIFQRLHLRREYSGNGVGLAITKRIVEKHGGQIWLESTPGKGTTFFFTLAEV